MSLVVRGARRVGTRWVKECASAPAYTARLATDRAPRSRSRSHLRALTLGQIPGHDPKEDPFAIGQPHLDELSASVRAAVGVMQNPVLDRAAGYFFAPDANPGKRIRPVMVFLMAGATAHAGAGILASQRQLAEITEMIHTASLLHDDVIDASDTRRGVGSVNAVFGNQLAVLAGDFLLARASVGLARLRDCDVVETLSTVIEHLVRGEVLQLNAGTNLGATADDLESLFERYLRKTFYKTASLVANSCRATAMLAGHAEATCQLAFDYGNNIGMSFQLVDDALDLTGSSAVLGKPALADLRAGVATAPFLFALQAATAAGDARLGDALQRRFSGPGDVEAAVEGIRACDGVGQTMEMAEQYADRAVESVEGLPPSTYRSGLINLSNVVLGRDR